jgi:Sulfate permease family
MESISISKALARKHRYSINVTQEIIAIGFANLFGGMFSAYAATGSFSRSAVSADVGAKTQLQGAITGGYHFIFMSVGAAMLRHALHHERADDSPHSRMTKYVHQSCIQCACSASAVNTVLDAQSRRVSRCCGHASAALHHARLRKGPLQRHGRHRSLQCPRPL